MKLSERLRILLKATLNDLFGEGSEVENSRSSGNLFSSNETGAERLALLTSEAEARLVALGNELRNAFGRQKKIELEWQEAVAQAQLQSDAVDEALKTGQDELARSRLVQAERSQARAKELNELHQAYQRLTNQIQEALQAQQAQLELVKRKSTEMAERERDADLMEGLVRLRREMARQAAAAQAALDEREEQIARREDRIAARREIDKISGS